LHKEKTSTKDDEEKSKEQPDIEMKDYTPGSVYNYLNFDPSKLNTMDTFKAKFDEIAHYLLNRCVLKINGTTKRVCEVEFYFCGGTHQDTFTHQDEVQQLNARWYFHKTGKKYRTGNYKGLDVTFGMDNKGYGGILFRAISDVDGSNYLSGPCLLVNDVLSLCEVKDIDELVGKENFSLHADHAGSLLYLEESNELKEAKLYESPRFGLNLKGKNEKGHTFIMRNYRYVIFPEKNKKGKPHIAVKLHNDGIPKANISKILKSTAKNVDGWIQAYEEGQTMETENFIGMKLSNSDVCKLYGCLNKSEV